MRIARSALAFVQSTLFGGTWDDLAFEVRVLRGEIERLHERLDKEVDALTARMEALEGMPPRGQGRARLGVMSAAERADAEAEVAEAVVACPGAAEPSGGAAVGSVHSGLHRPIFSPSMTIAQAHRADPGARAVFAAHHLPGCMDCALAETETIAEGAGAHGLDVGALLADLGRLARG